MQFLLDIFCGVLLFVAGGALIKYRKVVHEWTGNFFWAEQYLGRGGTFFVLILVGLGLMIWGVSFPFWGLEMLLGVDKDAPINVTQ